MRWGATFWHVSVCLCASVTSRSKKWRKKKQMLIRSWDFYSRSKMRKSHAFRRIYCFSSLHYRLPITNDEIQTAQKGNHEGGYLCTIFRQNGLRVSINNTILWEVHEINVHLIWWMRVKYRGTWILVLDTHSCAKMFGTSVIIVLCCVGLAYKFLPNNNTHYYPSLAYITCRNGNSFNFFHSWLQTSVETRVFFSRSRSTLSKKKKKKRTNFVSNKNV